MKINNPPPAINPDLAAGYRAFQAGDDAAAQAAYRKVLQADVRSVDALLGMAAIAMRQERNNDAMGWYGKVLEIEPRNSYARRRWPICWRGSIRSAANRASRT